MLSIALMTAESPLYEALRGYKNSSSEAVRRRHRLTGAALLATFARDHSNCLGEFDSVTAIPSVRRSAVADLIASVRDLREREAPALVAATEWTGRTVDPARYAVSRDVAGERVLVVDDTFTSGATMFSACATLREGGAQVVGPIAIGRFLRLEWQPSKQLLDRLSGFAWNPDECARCTGGVGLQQTRLF